ncbi:MAG: hypothetical protein HY671_04975 [Chloroflexi bacterium]|nr:hypothetical protein [Chloroflexota bacterium]
MEKANTVSVQQTPQPQVAVPPVGGTVLVAGYDPVDGSLRLLNLGTFHEAQVQAERLHALDRLDARNAKKEITVAAATAIGTPVTGALEAPAGEVWFIGRLSLVTPAGVTGNILVSRFPKKADGTDKEYLATDQAAGATTNYDLAGAGELGEELRLVGGDKLTVRGVVTAVPAADVTVTLTAYGRKGKRLI